MGYIVQWTSPLPKYMSGVDGAISFMADFLTCGTVGILNPGIHCCRELFNALLIHTSISGHCLSNTSTNLLVVAVSRLCQMSLGVKIENRCYKTIHSTLQVPLRRGQFLRFHLRIRVHIFHKPCLEQFEYVVLALD